MNLLGHRTLHRPGTVSGAATRTERTSADFLIDGQSLLEMLVKNAGGHSDFMGCFVSGYAESCERTRATLLDVPPENGKRVLLYICPECGDVGCGDRVARHCCRTDMPRPQAERNISAPPAHPDKILEQPAVTYQQSAQMRGYLHTNQFYQSLG